MPRELRRSCGDVAELPLSIHSPKGNSPATEAFAPNGAGGVLVDLRKFEGTTVENDREQTPSWVYLEAQRDLVLVTRLVKGITRVTMWVIGVTTLLTTAP